jgi:hypothetical protein
MKTIREMKTILTPSDLAKLKASGAIKVQKAKRISRIPVDVAVAETTDRHMSTPAKVTIEITPKGWTTKVIAGDGTELSSREMQLEECGARGTTPGDIYTDLQTDDDELFDLAEAIDDGDPYDIAKQLRSL